MRHKKILIASIATCIALVWLWLQLRAPESIIRRVSPDWVRRTVQPSPKSTRAGIMAKIEKLYATPITFYGKIIDQHGDPVPDADVRFDVLNRTGGSPPIQVKSDQTGYFSIAGIHGYALGVGVSKSGYRQLPPQDNKVTSSGHFEYDLAAGRPAALRKETPAVFILQKVGVLEPLTKIYKLLDLNGNGKPFEFSLDQKGGHAVVMKIVNRIYELPEEKRYVSRHNWNFEILVPDGGLVKREDEFNFEAPETGYAPRDFMDRPTTMPYGHNGWDSLETLSYFLRFNDGTYARVTLDVHADDRNYIKWESYYNPKVGSRNLEIAAKKPQ